MIGEEGKIVEAKAATNIFSPSEPIMRAINKNMISPDHVYFIYPKFWNFFDSLWSFHKMLFCLQCYCTSCSVLEYKFSSFSNLKHWKRVSRMYTPYFRHWSIEILSYIFTWKTCRHYVDCQCLPLYIWWELGAIGDIPYFSKGECFHICIW